MGNNNLLNGHPLLLIKYGPKLFVLADGNHRVAAYWGNVKFVNKT